MSVFYINTCFVEFIVLPFLFTFVLFHANFGHSIPDNSDLVGAGGADGWSWSVGKAWNTEGGREWRGNTEPFTSRQLIPLLKGLCSIMPDSFRKSDLPPPLFYKEMTFHTQMSLIRTRPCW